MLKNLLKFEYIQVELHVRPNYKYYLACFQHYLSITHLKLIRALFFLKGVSFVEVNSMSIHPGGRTIPLQFFLNFYSIFIVLRHVKLQNSRLVPLIVFELQGPVVRKVDKSLSTG